ncbi:MAG: hypothetical protein KF757_04725 [Phycisphaeraceae bacterium]|nr:hypothetical protein [Phycisphaeraceae bacterium]MCW5764246.1 hypothetical protein [Phycisphaeraceae bacterium]
MLTRTAIAAHVHRWPTASSSLAQWSARHTGDRGPDPLIEYDPATG